jgi:hypothetical protein
VKKLIHLAPQQPDEDTPQARLEALQTIAATRANLETEVRETEIAVSKTTANLVTICNCSDPYGC